MKSNLVTMLTEIQEEIPAEDITIIISTFGNRLKDQERTRTKKWFGDAQEAVPPGVTSQQMLIPNEKVGSFIGIAGRAIKKLESETNCKIEKLWKTTSHTHFMITGRIQNIEKAISPMQEIILRKSEGTKIKFDFEFEGMESPVVIAMINNGDIRGAISNSLSRANDRLFIISPSSDSFLKKALQENKIIERDVLMLLESSQQPSTKYSFPSKQEPQESQIPGHYRWNHSFERTRTVQETRHSSSSSSWVDLDFSDSEEEHFNDLVSNYLFDEEVPDMLTRKEIEENFGTVQNFMLSYGLKPYKIEDCEEAASISRALKENQGDY